MSIEVENNPNPSLKFTIKLLRRDQPYDNTSDIEMKVDNDIDDSDWINLVLEGFLETLRRLLDSALMFENDVSNVPNPIVPNKKYKKNKIRKNNQDLNTKHTLYKMKRKNLIGKVLKDIASLSNSITSTGIFNCFVSLYLSNLKLSISNDLRKW